MVFSWAFFMRLSTLCLVRHGSYQLKHTRAATFEITPLIPVSPIMETWHLVTRQKIVFKAPQRKTWVPNGGEEKKEKEKSNLCGWQRQWSQCKYARIMLDVRILCFSLARQKIKTTSFVSIVRMVLIAHFIMFNPFEGNWRHDWTNLFFSV